VNEKYTAEKFIYVIGNGVFTFSTIVLVWAIYRVARLFKHLSKNIINKAMITVHLFDYLILLVIDLIAIFIPSTDVNAQKITFIIICIASFVSSVVFALIINHIASKILAITAHSSETLPSSLIKQEVEVNLKNS